MDKKKDKQLNTAPEPEALNIWYFRDGVQVEADSYEEALKKYKEKEKKGAGSNAGVDIINM